ncbi:MAG: sulfotransferase, partial [Rhodospirillales bacterium]|nr:sulfotransferase [Rhodospirillales bacterium]
QSPAFLIGFPRSGTTLLEQIIKAHPMIETIEERPLLSSVEESLLAQGQAYPECLSELGGEQLDQLRRIYFDAMETFSGPRQGNRIYLDKMPLNTLKVPLIHRLFPRAKIIFVLRHPCDCCLSGVMQSYQPNDAMAGFLNIESAARFYSATMDFWRRCQDVLQLDCHMLRYEDLIEDYSGEAKAVLKHLGLAWDDAIQQYREKASDRLIATPSYHQVKEPIYRRAKGRWRTYAEFLEPVLPILAPHATAFGYDI